ncbi:hypothetical protein K2X92_01125 [Candidatus Gracilibacteria bacterium]|nr:hypothetical protein [Candidatus Gracilibacteria bacterium]
MKKNIIYITGNDSYGIEGEVKRWLGAFRGKFGDINIDRFDLSDQSSLKGIADVILMSGLFVEKRLFIFRGGRDRKSKAAGLEDILTSQLDNLPDDHFLFFHNISDKEEGLKTWLSKNADVRNIDTLWDKKIWESRFDIDSQIISLVLKIYQEGESSRERGDSYSLIGHDIAHTFEMISLLQESGKKLDNTEISGLCYGYGGDTLFSLVDAIMGLNIPLALAIYHRVTATNRIDEWFGSFVGLLRNNLYIKRMKDMGESENEIANLLKIHPYMLKKGYSSKISYVEIRKLYEKLISMSIAYKRGKGLKDSELGRILSIELALLGLQKSRN